ncbi:response regulator transcription factor [Sulfurospirillum sp. 1307]|jgi:DNA-binding response OmpR family regulator
MYNDFKDYTILYAEDDEGVREVTFSMLKRIFKEAYEAKDGLEAFEKYTQYKPDIIIADIKMPELSGIDLIKKIRQKDEKTKIMITTAFNNEEYLMEAIELNIVRYIVKPLTNRNLFPALQKAISKIDKIVMLGDEFYYDNRTSLFYYKNEIIQMSKKELLFLSLLVKNKDNIVTYEMIEDEVWSPEEMSLRSLRTIVGLIRKKIPYNIISNISNMGYKLKLFHE